MPHTQHQTRTQSPPHARPVPPDVDTALRRVADQIHRLNQAIVDAVEAGATVELLRRSRYHCGSGHWGDQMSPVVIMPENTEH